MLIRIFLVLLGCLSVAASFAQTPVKSDTISNWQIYYGKELVIHGNSVQLAEMLVPEIKLGREQLVVHYNHDTGSPKGQHVEIRDGDRQLLLVNSDVGTIYIDLHKALEKLHAGKHLLSFYYWIGDDRDKQWLGDLTVLE